MKGSCGNEKASDVLVEVNLDANEIKIDIQSKLKDMYGALMEKAVRDALSELNVDKAHVTLKDFGALDFVIRGRVKTATRRALEARGDM